jgi:hypothetical protein
MIDIRWDPEPWASLGQWLAPLPGQHQPPDPDLALADLDQLLEVVRVTFEGLSMPLAAPERFIAETPASADLIQLWANLVGPGTVVVVGFDVWPTGTYPDPPRWLDDEA